MSPKKRVLFVTASDTPWGAEQSLRALLTSTPSDWQCAVLACSDDVANLFRPFASELIVAAGRKSKILTLYRFARKVTAIHDQFDVVVIFSLKLLPLALMLRATLPSSVRFVADLHDTPVGADRILSKAFLPFVDTSIAISKYVVEHLAIRNAVIVPRPIAAASEGVGISEIHTRPANGESTTPANGESTTRIVIGIVGRIDPEKRIEIAIDAIGVLPDRFQLHVFGEPGISGGTYLESLRRMSAAIPRIAFHGFVPTDQIYEGIDGLVVCNEKEASGRTVGEAMLRSKIVFAPDRGGSQEFYDDLSSGFTYRALDAKSLARTVMSAFDGGHDLPAMRQRARAKIAAERSPGAVANRYFDVLRDVVERTL